MSWWAYAQTQDRWHLLASDADHRRGLHAVCGHVLSTLSPTSNEPDGLKCEHCWLKQLAWEIVRLGQRP